MTTLEKLSRANRWRIRQGVSMLGKPLPASIASTDEDGWNGHFLVPLEGEIWHVVLSDDGGWRHLSVTNAQKATMMASWNIMCRLKESFWSDEDWVCQYHPAKTDYINDHPYCLHLWQPLNETLPIPPYVFV